MKQFLLDNIFSTSGKVQTAKIKNSGEWIKKSYPEFFNEIIQSQPLIPFNQKIYNIINDIHLNPGCKTCGCDVKFISFPQGYSKYCYACSRKLSMSDDGKKSLKVNRSKIIDSHLQSFYNLVSLMDIQLLKNFIKATNINKLSYTHLTQYSLEFSSIINQTSFIPFNNSSLKALKLPERFYCILNDIIIIPHCPSCNNNRRFINSVVGYQQFCSKKCSEEQSAGGKLSNIETKIKKKLGDNFLLLEKYTGRKSSYKVRCHKEHIFSYKFHNGSCFDIHCPICEPYISKSKAEYEIKDIIESFNVDVTHSYKLKSKLEIDLFIPVYHFGIEYNGIYWHSELQGKNKNYHLNKTKAAANENINLIHIFENEWRDDIKQEIWKSIIKSKLGQNNRLYARKCLLGIVSNRVAKEFLTDNHLQGHCNSYINIGLYANDGLVALLTLSKARFNKKYDWEITRYCNKKGVNVIGGFSKLLKYFRDNHSGSIITYADKRYSTGDMYKKCGFTELKDSSPNYFYWKSNHILHSRHKFQKHKLKLQLEVFDKNLTEWENMKLNGWDRIWDCGNKVFELV